MKVGNKHKKIKLDRKSTCLRIYEVKRIFKQLELCLQICGEYFLCVADVI